MFRYEHRTDSLLSVSEFVLRVLRHAALATLVVALSLGAGVMGYRFTEEMSWVDAFLNACMILSGMGPVNDLHTNEGKLFASLYALYSGVLFLALMSIVLAPFVHRMLHRLHVHQHEAS